MEVTQFSARLSDQQSLFVHVFDTTLFELLIAKRQFLNDAPRREIESHQVPTGWIWYHDVFLRWVRPVPRLVRDDKINERRGKAVRIEVAVDVTPKLID